MTEIPNFAPGCFGSALAYQPENLVCKACPLRDMCMPVHIETLEKLREKIGISTTRRASQPKPSAAPAFDPETANLPVKVRALVERINKAGLRIMDKIVEGINPFEGKIPFMQITCQLLMRLGRPLDKGLLAEAFVRKLGWQKNTADAHARMAIQALAHIGIIDDTEQGATIRKVSNA